MSLDRVLEQDREFRADVLTINSNYVRMAQVMEKYDLCEVRINQYRSIFNKYGGQKK